MLKLGLQLFTLRNELALDFAGTLRKVAALGYQGVEFYQYYEHSVGEVKALLDETGLVPIAVHRPYDVLLHDIEAELTYNLELGIRNIVVPYIKKEQRKWPEVVDGLRLIGERVRDRGAVLSYHNHDFEFNTESDGRTAFETIFTGVTEDLLQIELDTYWVHRAGVEPAKLIKQYAGRIPIIHLKDMIVHEDRTAETVELGKGEIDLAAVLEEADAAGVKWAVVEQDVCNRPPFESIEDSMKWLKTYEYK
ncbi:Inosose dehydratase [compost metagenome]